MGLFSRIYGVYKGAAFAAKKILYYTGIELEANVRPSDRVIEYAFVIENLPRKKGTLLDVGCAGSPLPLIIAALGWKAYGMDLRNPLVSHPRFAFVKEDIRQTKLKSNFFDAVTAVSTIEHVGLAGRYGAKEDLEGDRKALVQMMRVTKPGGTVILTIPFGEGGVYRPFHRIYNRESLKNLIAGFKVKKTEFYQSQEGEWKKTSAVQAENTPAGNGINYSLALVVLEKRKRD